MGARQVLEDGGASGGAARWWARLPPATRGWWQSAGRWLWAASTAPVCETGWALCTGASGGIVGAQGGLPHSRMRPAAHHGDIDPCAWPGSQTIGKAPGPRRCAAPSPARRRCLCPAGAPGRRRPSWSRRVCITKRVSPASSPCGANPASLQVCTRRPDGRLARGCRAGAWGRWWDNKPNHSSPAPVHQTQAAIKTENR